MNNICKLMIVAALCLLAAGIVIMVEHDKFYMTVLSNVLNERVRYGCSF